MSDRHIIQTDILDKRVERIIVKTAIALGVSEASMARWYMYRGIGDELSNRGIPLTPRMIKKNWGNYSIKDWDRENKEKM